MKHKFEKHKISPFIINRRHRRNLKSIEKRKSRRKLYMCQVSQLSIQERGLSKSIKSLTQAIELLMPIHLKYLLNNENSPFNKKKLKKVQYKEIKVLKVPKKFSIIENAEESYTFIKDIIETIYHQACKQLWFNYHDCIFCDLPTQVFLDSILIDNDKFIRRCQKIEISQYLHISSIGAININDPKLQQMINSVGSPVELINRKIKFSNIIPYKLRHFSKETASWQKKLGQKDIDTSDLIQYVIDCLSRFQQTLTQSARQELGNVIGETISNAEEHSSLHNRYLIGYMQEDTKAKSHCGLLYLVMMNTGKTIYEKFKYPEEGKEINQDCLMKMQLLSDKFKKKSFLRPDAFTEENLWTLYTLQGGVSIIPPSIRKRGNGTIEFIDSFFKLKGSVSADNISHLSIISGNTEIDFDGTYKIHKSLDNDGHTISKMTFNKSNSLEELPDSKYVYHIKNYFPGTIIYAQLLINEKDIEIENEKRI